MKRIVVLNPPDGGKRFTTVSRATELVARKDARWNDPVKKSAIWFKATPAVLAERESRRLHKQGASVKWKVKPSAGAYVWQLRRI